jgi:tight adherence protein B
VDATEVIVSTVLMAVAIGLLYWSCREWASGLLDIVEKNVAEKLKAMRISTKNLRRLLGLWVYLMAIVLFGFWIGYGSPIFGLVGIMLMGPLPWFLLKRLAHLRRQQIDDQLAGSMTTLSGAIRAGLSLAQALEILADQSPKPISMEFQHIVGQYKMGKTLEQTLNEAKQRLSSDNFSMFAAAMLASRESGGRLNETIERIASSVREFQRLERKVNSETAQARKSAIYMALAPPMILVVYYFIDPLSTTRLFTTLPGQIMLSAAVVLNVLAWLWARKILSPDI